MKKIFIAILCLFSLIVGCGEKTTTVEEKKETSQESQEFEPASRWNDDMTFKLESEPNTNEAEKEIYDKAKEDANKYTTAAIPKILDYIKQYSNDPWKDRSTMEQMLYWGTVINNSDLTTEKEKKVGYKATSVVSFVYRGKESKEDAEEGRKNLIKYIDKLDE